ncbi:Uncharacterised protein [marine metagenome]
MPLIPTQEQPRRMILMGILLAVFQREVAL